MGNKLLVFIVFIAFVLRFINLNTLPPSLTWDEVAWGYNAYSLGIDGRDEFGRFLPLDYLESFGDFKPVVYAYLDIIPVKVFGLNEFSVRLPSALFGVLTVFLTFLLTKRIFFNSKNKDQYAIFSTLIMAVSPWHIMLSRAAFEANVSTFFIVLGIWAFLKAVQDNKKFLFLSTLAFVLSIYTFNTARIVSPLIVLFLAFAFRKDLLRIKKEVLLATILGILLIMPVVKFLFSAEASLRFREVNIFSDIGVIEVSNQQIENDNNAWWSKIIHNRRAAFSVEYLRHYFDNFSPSFLFIKGDGNPKFSTQDVGQLYLWDLPFFVIGILFLFRKREGNWWLIPAWLLLAIIPAATARETPHALRIETTLPTFQIIVAFGFVTFINFYKRYKFIIPLLIFTLFFNVLYFIHGYIAHYPREFSGEWQYGYKESIAYVKDVEKDYDEIRVTNKLGRPYAYYLFHLKIPPKEFRKTVRVSRNSFGFVNVDGFSKYRFSDSIGSLRSRTRKILYIDAPSNVPPKVEILKRFYLQNGEEILTAYRYSI